MAAYANTGVLRVHQAPGDGQEEQPLRRGKMFSTLYQGFSTVLKPRTSKMSQFYAPLNYVGLIFILAFGT
jgi:hypothetical protein